MILLNKVLLVLLYALALVQSHGVLAGFGALALWVHWAVAGLWEVHALEVVVFWRAVRLHPGPVLDSVVLTLLFGFLHWKPLADRARRTAQA